VSEGRESGGFGEILRAPPVYGRIVRTYFGWARSLLPLAVLVFLPVGLLHAIPIHFDATELDLDGAIQIAGLLGVIFMIATTGLIGEVFYSGAVAIALTHPHDGRPPPLREVVRMVSYGRLIAVDLLFGLLVAVGFAAFVVPGVVLFVYLALAAPVVEVERRTVREALRRSVRIVRGHFWLVFAVLVPLEIGGDAATSLAVDAAQAALGETIWAEWLSDAAANIVVTPFYAIAAVLLALDLIEAHDGQAPRLHSSRPRR
jgi:hypothetical protein